MLSIFSCAFWAICVSSLEKFIYFSPGPRCIRKITFRHSLLSLVGGVLDHPCVLQVCWESELGEAVPLWRGCGLPGCLQELVPRLAAGNHPGAPPMMPCGHLRWQRFTLDEFLAALYGPGCCCDQELLVHTVS